MDKNDAKERINDLTKRLGLEPPDQFEVKRGKGARSSGRTTSMLLIALDHLDGGEKVKVNAYSLSYAADLGRKVRDMAAQLGINVANLIPGTSFKLQDERPYHGSDVVILNDHWRG